MMAERRTKTRTAAHCSFRMSENMSVLWRTVLFLFVSQGSPFNNQFGSLQLGSSFCSCGHNSYVMIALFSEKNLLKLHNQGKRTSSPNTTTGHD